MAKGSIDNVPIQPLASLSTVPTGSTFTTLTTTEGTTPTSVTTLTTTENPTSPTNNALSTNIGFENFPLTPLSNIEPEQNSSFAESCQQHKVLTNIPSAPPITQIDSCPNDSITPLEMSSLKAILREIKVYVYHSKSKDAKEQKLTTSLEKMYDTVREINSRISLTHANVINEEIKEMIKFRRNKKNQRKHDRCMDKKASTPTGCLLASLVFLMLLRLILDTFCLIKLNMLPKLELVAQIFLAVTTIGWILTCCMLSCYCFRRGKNVFICGYISMTTYILQGCLKCNHSNSNRIKSKHTGAVTLTNLKNNANVDCQLKLVTETSDKANNKNSLPHATNRNSISVENVSLNQGESTDQKYPSSQRKLSTSDINITIQNNHQDLRIIAVSNLEHTIKQFLVDIHGLDYLNQEKFATESNNCTQAENCAIKNNVMTQNVAYTDPVVGDPGFWCCCPYSHTSNVNNDTILCCFLCNDRNSCNCCEDDCGCCEEDCGCCEGDCGNCDADCGGCEGDCGNCDADCGGCDVN